MTAWLKKDDAGNGPEWNLERASFKDHYERRTVGGTTALYRCRQYVIAMRRRGFGITSVRPDNRNKKLFFDLHTGPETQAMLTYGSSRYFICTSDDIQIVDIKTGEAVEVQVWEHYSTWAKVPGSEFGTFSDDDPQPESDD